MTDAQKHYYSRHRINTSVLPDDTEVHPGHGESTILKKEKQAFEAFSSKSHSPDLCGDVLWLSS